MYSNVIPAASCDVFADVNHKVEDHQSMNKENTRICLMNKSRFLLNWSLLMCEIRKCKTMCSKGAWPSHIPNGARPTSLRAQKGHFGMPTSHIQRSPAEFVDHPNVVEFHIRQGVERIFRLKSTLSHFGRGSGGALWTSRPAALFSPRPV